MKLRTVLFLSSSVQLFVLGALFLVGYAYFQLSIVPDLESYFAQRAETSVTALPRELDVALGAEDARMVQEAVASTTRDPDLAWLEVRDATDKIVFQHGVVGPAAGPEGRAHRSDHGMVAWSSISLEGLRLGRVAVAYATTRVEAVETWVKRFSIVVLLVWLLSLVYSLRFSRAFVAPIRAMQEFSRNVANGALEEQLDCRAPGELGELKANLNSMARELAEREQERRQASARAETMQQELLAVSRMAGMAEVATGVLHNVGNVLNSLNTSVSVLRDRVRTSKVGSFEKAVTLYRDHPGGLASFLATDRGRTLPQFLDKVATHLAAENAATHGELESITRNLDHIKSIVATQQAYTRAVPVREVADLPALIDDALGMVAESFARHQVEVVKEYEPIPTVITDRHRVLQIVVNLVSNARHALNESTTEPRRLAVHLGPHGDAAVAITIEDSGIGIAKDNLSRIFQHGFTTKKDGHGFGLHSAANAATEIGGNLGVASDGIGTGARFTLVIPCTPPVRSDDVHN